MDTSTRGLSHVADMMTTIHFHLRLTKYMYGLHIILKCLNTCNTKTHFYKKKQMQH
jgi:hypothetical protein